MDRYVNECADALFKPEGRRIRAWLNDVRRLPDDVLAANRIGADLGPRRQWRPDGMPRAGGAVLPVIEEGHAIYAQLRRIHPKPDGSRYLNPRSELAPNPRLAFLMPVEARHIELIVTEGTIDALSATTAGYRSVAVLSAAYPDRSLALRLSQLPYPIVIAFDQDEIGRKAGNRLATLLDSCQSHNVSLVIPAADLNVALVKALDIERMVKQLVERTASGRCRGPALQL